MRRLKILPPRKKALDIAQHAREHRFREFSRERVLLAGMIRRVKPRQIVRQGVAGAMSEAKRRQTFDFAAVLEQPQKNAHRDASQCQQSAWPEDFEFLFEVRAAVREFGRQRLIAGRRATRTGCDVCVSQLEPVARVRRSGLIRESGAIERAEQKISRTVTGEDPPGAIAAMRGGRESKDEQFCARITEARHRFAPIFAIEEGKALFTRYFFAIRHQPRAFPAAYDLAIQLGKRLHRGLAKLTRDRRHSRNIYSLECDGIEPPGFAVRVRTAAAGLGSR